MTLLEVERKFSWKQANFKVLISNGGSPPFIVHPRITSRAFRDIYYDSSHKLSSKGLWVRKRLHHGPYTSINITKTGVWEAKQAMLGSSFNNSTYEETQDTNHLLQMINKHIPGCLGPEEDFGLKELCQSETLRRSFLADHKFTVVLDETDFGHSVGEVEILADDAKQAHADIGTFLNHYAWFFDCSKPKGKLTAYLEKFPLGRDKTKI